jgi:hypothetical protein
MDHKRNRDKLKEFNAEIAIDKNFETAKEMDSRC